MLVAQVLTRAEALAAVGAGADGVCISVDPLKLADGARLIEDLHLCGASVWVDLGQRCPNAHPSDAVARAMAECAAAGAEGLLVKDLGMLALARAAMPSFAVVAGGDLALSSGRRRELYERAGLSGAFVSPQLAVGQIARAAEGSSLKLWAYVHGRLDLTYGGPACGEFGPSWRLGLQSKRWQLHAPEDGAETPRSELADAYLLNLKTLAAIKPLRQLRFAGVEVLVINAAGMGPAWVAAVCRVYRAEVDWLMGKRGHRPGLAQQFRSLSSTFNTGLGPGFYMAGSIRHLVNRGHPGGEGVAVGKVESVRRADSRALIRLSLEVRVSDRLEARTAGGGADAVRLNLVDKPAGRSWPAGSRVWANVGGRVMPGDTVYRVWAPGSEPSADTVPACVEVDVDAHLAVGAPLVVRLRARGRCRSAGPQTADGGAGIRTVEVEERGRVQAVPADGSGISEQWLARELARFGGRPLRPGRVVCHVEPGLYLPPSEVNAVRRNALAKLVREYLSPTLGQASALSGEAAPSPSVRLDGVETGPLLAAQPSRVRVMVMVRGDIDPLAIADAGADGVCLNPDSSYSAMMDYFAEAKGAGLVCAYCSDVAMSDDDLDHAVSQMMRASDAGADLIVVEDVALLAASLDAAPDAVVLGPGCSVASPEAMRWAVDAGAAGFVVPYCGLGQVPGVPQDEAIRGPNVLRGAVVGGRPYLGAARRCVRGAELGEQGGRGGCSAPCRGRADTWLMRSTGDGTELRLATDRWCRMHLYGPEVPLIRGHIEQLACMGYDWVWLDLRAYTREGAVRACARYTGLEA